VPMSTRRPCPAPLDCWPAGRVEEALRWFRGSASGHRGDALPTEPS